MPVKGCCALTQVLSVSLPLEQRKPVSHRNFHWDLSDHADASPRFKRNWPAMSAAASVAFDLFFRGNGDNEIAGLRTASFGELFFNSLRRLIFYRGGQAFGRKLHKNKRRVP